MTLLFTESQILERVAHLTRPRLLAFVEAEIVVPMQADGERFFRQIDLARLELLCELADHFDMSEDAAALALRVIDQLHAARRDLNAIAQVLAEEPAEVRARIGAALRAAQTQEA